MVGLFNNFCLRTLTNFGQHNNKHRRRFLASRRSISGWGLATHGARPPQPRFLISFRGRVHFGEFFVVGNLGFSWLQRPPQRSHPKHRSEAKVFHNFRNIGQKLLRPPKTNQWVKSRPTNIKVNNIKVWVVHPTSPHML